MAINWTTCMNQVRSTMPGAISDWVAATRMDGGRISGMAAYVTPGSIKGSGLDTFVLAKLLGMGMRSDVAGAIAGALGNAWTSWIDNLKMDLPGVLPPSYLAWPGQTTSVDPVTGIFTLFLSRSIGEPSLRAESLRQALTNALSGFADDCEPAAAHSSCQVHGLPQGSAQQLVTRAAVSFRSNGGPSSSQSVALYTRMRPGQMSDEIAGIANWIDEGFRDWKKKTKLGQIYGQGTRTTYSPPAVPLGQVLDGVLSGTPALRETIPFGS